MLKPEELPRPWIDGGCMKMICPARCPMKRMLARMASALAAAPSRPSKSFSLTKSIAEFCPLEPKLKPSAPKAASTVAAFVRKAGGVSEDLGHLMQSLLVGIEADRPVLAPASGLCRHNPRLLARHEVSMREVKERLVAILAARLPEEDPVVLRLLALEPVRLAIDRWLADLEPSPTEAVAAIWPRLARAGGLLGLPQGVS